MTPTHSLTLQDRCRFIRLLTELSDGKPNSVDYNLAERLGHFVGVSGSMTLARGLRSLPVAESGRPMSAGAEAVRADVLEARVNMIRNIVDSFSPDVTDTPIKLPSIETGVRAEALRTVEPYLRFYTAQQVEMAVGIQAVRDRLRLALCGLSTELHKLTELDKILENSLEAHARKQFNLAQKVLEQRFKALLNKSQDSSVDLSKLPTKTDAWLARFYSDMRELLLAECELRMQPVFGLLEALNEHEGIVS